MLYYVIRRVLYTLPICVAVGFVCFLLLYLSPGDPIDAIVSPDTPQEVVDRIRARYGLDRPFLIQFFLWLGNIAQGDFGTSPASGRAVLPELLAAFFNTFRLAGIAAGLGFLMGSLLGATAGIYRGTWIDKIISAIAASGVSVPHYWLGMLMVIVFSVQLQLLPAMGAGAAGSGDWAWDWQHLQFLVLPALTLSIIPLGIIARTVRGVTIDVLTQDYITTLRSKGLRRRRIAFHVIKNAAPPVLAVMALQLGYLMGGSILVETVFAWPGTGSLLNRAIFQRDIPMLQGTILLLALFFVALNLLADLAQTLLDPRIRRS